MPVTYLPIKERTIMAKGTKFTLDNLRLLDFGRIGVAFNTELERVVHDCMDRPAEDKARSVIIRFNFAPLNSSPGASDCDQVKVECEIASSIPKRRTKVYSMIPHVDGQLEFNPDLSDQPEGETIFDKQEKEDDSDE